MFTDYWWKWLLGGMGATATLLIAFCGKKIWSAIKTTIEFWKEKDKAEYLKDIYNIIEKNKKDTEKKLNDFHKELEEFKENSIGADEEHQEQMKIIVQGIQALQKGVLSSHFNMLLNKSMTYIKRGWISVEELNLYEEELGVYKDLHGNGHLDPWIEKVRRLPNQKPENKKKGE